jgi:hypothetical protein
MAAVEGALLTLLLDAQSKGKEDFNFHLPKSFMYFQASEVGWSIQPMVVPDYPNVLYMPPNR